MITVEIKEDGNLLLTLEAKEDGSYHASSWHEQQFYESQETAYFSGTVQCRDRGMHYSVQLFRQKKKHDVNEEKVQCQKKKKSSRRTK